MEEGQLALCAVSLLLRRYRACVDDITRGFPSARGRPQSAGASRLRWPRHHLCRATARTGVSRDILQAQLATENHAYWFGAWQLIAGIGPGELPQRSDLTRGCEKAPASAAQRAFMLTIRARSRFQQQRGMADWGYLGHLLQCRLAMI